MLIGAHVSAAGGVSNAPLNGAEIGAETIQLFCKNQRQWEAKPTPPEEVEAFRANVDQTGLRSIIVHDSYLINLGAPKQETWQRSREAFADEMQRCQALGVAYLNFHPGSHLGEGIDACIDRITSTLSDLLAKHGDESLMLLIENTAGQGTNVGSRFEEIGQILEAVDDDRMGVCIDTQHAFAAGYDHREPEGYEAMWEAFDDAIGMKHLRAFHLNDSKRGLGERVDRHDRLGEGEIGWGLFERLVNDPRFAGIPGTMETPGGMEGWREEIAQLKRLRGPKAPDRPVRAAAR